MPTRQERAENFLAAAKLKHNGKYDYSRVEYVNTSAKVSIGCPVHGWFIQAPGGHLAGRGCPKCGLESLSGPKTPVEEILKRFREVHGDRYDYKYVPETYSGVHKPKVRIVCREHGEFLQTPSKHVHRGHGCPDCGNIARAKPNYSAEKLINRFEEMHGDTYGYQNVAEDFVGVKDKIRIECRIHGTFKQTPDSHLQGAGCVKCAEEVTGWTWSQWKEAGEKSKNFDGYKFYLVRCFNDEESFLKAGKTFLSLKSRFKGSDLPYNYEVLSLVQGEARYISELEIQFKREYKEFVYQPKVSFGGQTECFSETLCQ